MELKLVSSTPLIWMVVSFNRTFMELKLVEHDALVIDAVLLIAPLWN